MASRTTELQELQKTRQLSLEVFAKTSQNKKTCVASRAPDHVAVCFEFLQLFSRTRTCLAWVCTVCKFSPMYQIAYYTLSGLPGEWKFWSSTIESSEASVEMVWGLPGCQPFVFLNSFPPLPNPLIFRAWLLRFSCVLCGCVALWCFVLILALGPKPPAAAAKPQARQGKESPCKFRMQMWGKCIEAYQDISRCFDSSRFEPSTHELHTEICHMTLTKSQMFCVYIERSGKIDLKDLISTWDQHDLVRPRCRTQQILRRSQRGKHFVQTSRRSISMPTVLSKPENQMFIDFPSIHAAHGFLSIAARCCCFWRCLDAPNSKPGKPVSCLGWRFRDVSDFSA